MLRPEHHCVVGVKVPGGTEATCSQRLDSLLTDTRRCEWAAAADQMCQVVVLVISMLCEGYLSFSHRRDIAQCCLRAKAEALRSCSRRQSVIRSMNLISQETHGAWPVLTLQITSFVRKHSRAFSHIRRIYVARLCMSRFICHVTRL